MVPKYCKCGGRIFYGSEIHLVPQLKHTSIDETVIWGECEKCGATISTYFKEYKTVVEKFEE